VQNNEVEIIKLGDVMKMTPSTTDFSQNILIMTVEEDDAVISHYLTILRDHCAQHCPQYSFMKTKGIVRSSGADNYSFGPIHSMIGKHRIGVSDGSPIVGQPFTINNNNWHTSKIELIISDNILITKNSVYAIHNNSVMRDQKLKDLGIQ
jgi:hypothetical protein